MTAARVDLTHDVGGSLRADTSTTKAVEEFEDAHVDAVALDLGRIFHGRERSRVFGFFETWHRTRWFGVV